VAEDIVYHETTTGTKNDIEQATNIARRMVTEWGMSKELGFVSFGQEEEPIFIGKEIAQHKDYSEYTAQKIDTEVKDILDECLADTRKILTEHRDQLEALTDELVVKETLEDAQIRKLLGFPEYSSAASLEPVVAGSNGNGTEAAPAGTESAPEAEAGAEAETGPGAPAGTETGPGAPAETEANDSSGERG
jgi:cell division protease FtsH